MAKYRVATRRGLGLSVCRFVFEWRCSITDGNSACDRQVSIHGACRVSWWCKSSPDKKAEHVEICRAAAELFSESLWPWDWTDIITVAETHVQTSNLLHLTDWPLVCEFAVVLIQTLQGAGESWQRMELLSTNSFDSVQVGSRLNIRCPLQPCLCPLKLWKGCVFSY